MLSKFIKVSLHYNKLVSLGLFVVGKTWDIVPHVPNQYEFVLISILPLIIHVHEAYCLLFSGYTVQLNIIDKFVQDRSKQLKMKLFLSLS